MESKYLLPGDYFIVDNSRIHTSEAGFRDLVYSLKAAGISLRLLPKYSPELNPIELVFAYVKHLLRNYYQPGVSLRDHIINAFGMVTRDMVYNFYVHCLNPCQQRV